MIIAGGGIVGLSTALGLHSKGKAVQLMDKNGFDPQEESPRLYALNHASIRLLKQLDIWSLLPKEACVPYEKMKIWEEHTNISIDFDSTLIIKSELGFMVKEHDLRNALLSRCQALNIPLLPWTEVLSLKTNTKGIDLLTPQKTYHTPFLFITDGAHSKLRDMLNIPMTTWPYHQCSLTAEVQTEFPHDYTAYQCFTNHGPLAFLPLKDPHQCSIVWSADKAYIQEKMTQDEDLFNQALAKTFQYQLGACQLRTQRHQFPLIMRHAQRYYGPHWVLMGDAAHTLHPLAGLGLNLGLSDLNTWLTLIDQYPSITPAMLGAYQRIRTTEAWKYISLIQCIKTGFLSPFPVVRSLRQAGMKLINQCTPLKTLIIKVAQGDTAIALKRSTYAQEIRAATVRERKS